MVDKLSSLFSSWSVIIHPYYKILYFFSALNWVCQYCLFLLPSCFSDFNSFGERAHNFTSSLKLVFSHWSALKVRILSASLGQTGTNLSMEWNQAGLTWSLDWFLLMLGWRSSHLRWFRKRGGEWQPFPCQSLLTAKIQKRNWENEKKTCGWVKRISMSVSGGIVHWICDSWQRSGTRWRIVWRCWTCSIEITVDLECGEEEK